MDLSNCLFRDDIPIDVRKLIEKEISRQKIQETNNQKRFEELEEALDHTSNMIQVSGINMIWKPAKGVCTFEGLPVAMMWIQSTLAGLMAGTQKMVGTKRFSLALQSEGRRSVEADWDVISQFDDFQEGFRAIANIAAVAGWGEWLLLSIDESNRECRFRVRNSWEGRYQKALGVCWGSAMLAGKFSGYCTKLFKTNCWSEQTTFIAKGDKYDEFICKPSKRSVEEEIETLLISNEATKADMAVALKRLHEEVNKRKESEERYRTLITTTSEGIWVSDLNNITILVNPAMEKILGYSKDELIGHSVKEFLSDES
ncbi:MAG: PAS domain S-box protein, partial [Promethearchaeota archaeon]